MSEASKLLLSKIGETDQAYLQENSSELSLERGKLRLELVTHSRVKSEQIHFLQEAIVILEQARVEVDEMPLSLYLALSLHLAQAYMIYFEVTGETRFALITQQVLKPLSHYQDVDIFFMLAYAAISQKEVAMTRHWLKKYADHPSCDFNLLIEHPAWKTHHQDNWWIELVKRKSS